MLFSMIFFVETETRELSACSEDDVMGECEAIDVEAAQFLFWNVRGEPLEPQFTIPNKRGLFTVKSGEYVLVPAAENHHCHLLEALKEVSVVEIEPPLDSVEAVRRYVQQQIEELQNAT